MIEILLLVIALAMDAFAVSIGLGAKLATSLGSSLRSDVANPVLKKPSRLLLNLALMAALYFGLAQGIMPLIGYLLGAAMLSWLASLAPWIACLILVSLGSKMLYEALKSDPDEADHKGETEQTTLEGVTTQEAVRHGHVQHRIMLTLAIATSIDAMAAGFTLTLLPVNAWLACAIIAVVTALFSILGVYLGRQSGTWLEDKAEVLGGVVLILIGIKMVL